MRFEFECSEGHAFLDADPYQSMCPVIVGRTPGPGRGREIACEGETRRIGTGSREANRVMDERRGRRTTRKMA